METIKLLLPVITFLLGVLTTPLTEILKDSVKNRKQKKLVSIELDDYLINLKVAIQKIDENITIRKANNKNYIFISTPVLLPLMSLPKYLDEILLSLSKSQRRAYKTILLIQKKYEELTSFIQDTYAKDNHACLDAEKAMGFSLLLSYYMLETLKEKKSLESFEGISDENLIREAAKLLTVSYPFD